MQVQLNQCKKRYDTDARRVHERKAAVLIEPSEGALAEDVNQVLESSIELHRVDLPPVGPIPNPLEVCKRIPTHLSLQADTGTPITASRYRHTHHCKPIPTHPSLQADTDTPITAYRPPTRNTAKSEPATLCTRMTEEAWRQKGIHTHRHGTPGGENGDSSTVQLVTQSHNQTRMFLQRPRPSTYDKKVQTSTLHPEEPSAAPLPTPHSPPTTQKNNKV